MLFMELFSPAEVREWLSLARPELRDVSNNLPGDKATKAELMTALVEALADRGLVDEELFRWLLSRRPRRAEDITAAAVSWGVALPKEAPPPVIADATPASQRAPLADRLVAVSPRPRRLGVWALLGLLAVGIASAAAWFARPLSPPSSVPIAVVHRDGADLSALLLRLVALQARAVVLDAPLDAETVGADRAALDGALIAARRAGLPVLAVHEGEADLYPRCGEPPCLDALLQADEFLDPRQGAEPRFDTCVHDLPTVPLALAVLADPAWSPPWNATALEGRCQVEVEPVLPPETPCARPWGSVTAAELLSPLGMGTCGVLDEVLGGHVVLVGLRSSDARYTLRGSADRSPARADLLAALAWSLIRE